jgi:hypothetical protein
MPRVSLIRWRDTTRVDVYAYGGVQLVLDRPYGPHMAREWAIPHQSFAWTAGVLLDKTNDDIRESYSRWWNDFSSDKCTDSMRLDIQALPDSELRAWFDIWVMLHRTSMLEKNLEPLYL